MMKIRIHSQEDRLKVAAILIANGYRVEQGKEGRPGKKAVDYVLVVKDVRDGDGED